MFGLFVTFFVSVFSLYLVSYGLVLKAHYEKMKELREDNAVYQSFVLAASGNSTGMQEVVPEDIDVKRDNCMQAVIQVCYTLAVECSTSDPLDTWGWALAAATPPYGTLDSGDYQEGSNSTLIVKGSGYVDLAKVPAVTTKVSGCSRSDLISRGSYYYNTVVRVLGCDDFNLDVNGVKMDGSVNPCSYLDILRYK